jgi:hypothetical protein
MEYIYAVQKIGHSNRDYSDYKDNPKDELEVLVYYSTPQEALKHAKAELK